MNHYIYALGFFDGVHLGHQALLQAVKELAAPGQRGVITFAAHPDTLVFGTTPKLINSPRDRVTLLREQGMDRVVTLPFDRRMLDTPWEEFLDRMRQTYNAAGFVCGEDFCFGKGGEGNAQKLREYCRRENLPCGVVADQLMGGVRISSTVIRQQLEEGKMAQAVRFLGHPYLLTGQVVHGKQLGRTLGIPTANLLLPPELAVPRFGVYAGIAYVEGTPFPAVTNVGVRPTVSGHGVTVETWILDYAGDLYDRTLRLELTDFLRPEQKFESLEALQEAVRRNGMEARALAATSPVFKNYSQPCTCVKPRNQV